MTDRDRFAAEVILASWVALACALAVILALGTRLERVQAELDARCTCEVTP